MGGRTKQAPFKIEEIICADRADDEGSEAAYQVMADIAARILKMKSDLKIPPE